MMLYDSEATLKKTLTDSTLEMIALSKEYKTVEKHYESGTLRNEYTSTRTTYFTKAEIDELRGIYGSSVFGAVDIQSNYNVQANSKYWKNEVGGFAHLTENHPLLSKVTAGSYPDSDTEIMISSYMANVMMNCKPYDAKSGSPITVGTIDEMVGKSINLDGSAFTVSGIIESPELPSKFDVLKEEGAAHNYSLEYEFERALSDSYYLTVFVTEDTLLSVAERFNSFSPYELFNNRELSVRFMNEDGTWDELDSSSNGAYTSYSDAKPHITVTRLDGKTGLDAGEVLIPIDTLYSTAHRLINSLYNETYNELNDAKERYGYNESRYNIALDMADGVTEGDKWNEAFDLIYKWEVGKTEDRSS